MGKELTDKGIADAAKELGVEPAAIRAVDEVESKGDGFLSDGRVKILFERHKFHKYTDGQYDASHPDISNKVEGGYGKAGAHQYARFSEAFALDPEAAMKSASWGRYQIMGFNHKAAGFDTVGEFVDAMKISEDEQLKAFVKLIKSWGLAGELRSHDWAGFARQYNGAAYKKNKYDTKMAAAYERFKRMPVDPGAAPTDRPADKPDTSKPDAGKPSEEKAEDSTVEVKEDAPQRIEVKSTGMSLPTKIGAAAGPIGTAVTALGIKIGGIQITQGTIYALCGLGVVAIICSTVIYITGKNREQRRLELGMNNLADRNRNNVVAAGGQG